MEKSTYEKLTQEELTQILIKHQLWLNKKENGKMADLSYKDLSYKNLSNSNLSYADLSNSNLESADLSNSNLRGTTLLYANLRNTKLSDCIGLISQSLFVRNNFTETKDGFIAYMCVDKKHDVACGQFLKENLIVHRIFNPNNIFVYDRRCIEYFGYIGGTEVATLDWVKNHCTNNTIWKVLIKQEWCSHIMVPYNTDGKILCESIMLLEIIDEKSLKEIDAKEIDAKEMTMTELEQIIGYKIKIINK